MSRALVGAAVGTAGTTAYLKPDLILDLVRSAAPAAGTKELQHLSELVEQLSREVRGASRGSVTIVRSDSGSSSSSAFYIITAVGISGALYLSLFRGWRLSDLCYVTQRTFRQGVVGLSAGLESLNTRLADVKSRLQARIAEVSRKQDEAALAQGAMRAHLAEVGADVDAVRGQVGQVHAAVLDLDAALAQVGADQRHALHGIYVLCKAVSEISAGSAIASKRELLEFTQSPVWQRIRPAGLEGILRDEDTNSTYGNTGRGYLLGGTGGVGVGVGGGSNGGGGGFGSGGIGGGNTTGAFGAMLKNEMKNLPGTSYGGTGGSGSSGRRGGGGNVMSGNVMSGVGVSGGGGMQDAGGAEAESNTPSSIFSTPGHQTSYISDRLW